MATNISKEMVKRLDPKIDALWLSGSLARGDFISGVSAR